jgi:molybdopterin-guanine dinucleotide biosynthesis protein A
MYKDITGIILSGGRSSRMGVNKSLLQLGNKSVIEHVVDTAKLIFRNVILITNNPVEYLFLDIPIYRDIFKDVGPIAGIHSGLVNSKTEKNFFLSCDTPLITEEIIRYITEYKTEKPVTICIADGFTQNLNGIFSRIVISELEKFIQNSDTINYNSNNKSRTVSVKQFLAKTKSEIINLDELEFYKQGSFFNINRPEDYKKILNHF